MNFLQNKPVSALLLLFVFLVVSCSTEPQQKPIEGAGEYMRKEQQPEFPVPAPYASMKYKVVRIDVDRDGYDDAVLTVLASKMPEVQNLFDSVFVYQYSDSSHSFVRKTGTAVYYGSTVEMLDLNGDEHPEALVYTNAGGNDPVVGNGLTVIEYTRNGYTTPVTLDGGDPEVVTIDAQPKPVVAIKVFSDYWPDNLSHAESVRFLDSLIILRNITATEKTALEQRLFQQVLAEAEEEYRQAKNRYAERQDDEAASDVYGAAVRTIKYYEKLGMQDSIRKLSESEGKFWRGALPPENQNVLKQLATPGSSS